MERIPKWFKTRSILLFSKTVRYFDSREWICAVEY